MIALEPVVPIPDRIFEFRDRARFSGGFILASRAGKLVEARIEHFDAGGGARHDAPKQGKRGPVLDALHPLGSGVGNHKLPGELDDVIEEGGIVPREIVGPFERFPRRERRVLIHPFLDVGSLSLDEILGEGAALRLRRSRQVEGFELGLEQAQQ